MIEALIRRDRWIVLFSIAALTLLSWSYLAAGAGMGMSAFDMASFTLFPHRALAGAAPANNWTAEYWAIVILMWWIMMIAMMMPAASPMILLYARAVRHAQSRGQIAPGSLLTAVFTGSYLLTWLAFSIAAGVLTWRLEQAGLIAAMSMSSLSAWASALTLGAAGLYQLSPLKSTCLRHCRMPAEFLARHWRPGVLGAMRMGARHGGYCVGCCALLMALLFVGGVMNVLWIGLLALFALLERLAPGGPSIARMGGAVLIVWAGATLLV